MFELMTTTPVGQWNSYDITVVGDRATMMVNGKTTDENVQIPGSRRAVPSVCGMTSAEVSTGPAGQAVQFRNILIRKLPRKGG